MVIYKTNNKLFEGTYEEAGSHYYVHFNCEKCGKEAKKQKRRIELNGFICQDCLYNGRTLSLKTKKKISEASKRNNNIQLMRDSLLKSNGVDNASKLEEVKEKRKQTNIKRYGGTSPMSSNKVKEKVVSSLLKTSVERIIKGGFTPLFNIEDFSGKYGKTYKWKCNTCGTIFEDKFNDTKLIPRCPTCFPYIKGYSNGEIELLNFIDKAKKMRDKYEIDAFIEDKNIGFEFDGLYWHSDIFKDKNYHLMKNQYFKEKGIRVYHIFEDEWIDKQEIVKSIINTKLGIFNETIYARKCIIKEVSTEESKEFQEDNHIQGKTSSSVNIGLYYNDELVSLMTFGKSRFDKIHQWELVRFVNKKNTKVVGGASRLFKFFIKNYNPKNIVSYSDERLFDGGLYEILGFTYSHTTPPQYYYVKNGYRYNRMNFQKHMLKKKLKKFNEEFTERENMQLNGFNRIYDCGQKVWKWNL